jgi:hypothetical protein
MPKSSRVPLLAAAGLVLIACGGGDSTADTADTAESPMTDTATDTPITVAGVGFSTPESVLHDAGADVYLVSNINGSPLDKDGNGFISKLSPSGEVVALKWIDGAAEGVTLNAPKGMAISGGVLYVADIDCVRRFDAASGAPQGEVCVDGASFLNDVAAHPDGGVLVTDSGLDGAFAPTGTDAVYHISGDRIAPVVRDAALGAPNGVTMAKGLAYVATFMSGDVFTVDSTGARATVLHVDGGQFDGIEVLDDGRVLASNWATSCVHQVDTDGTLTCLVSDVEAPADIGLDRGRNRVLIPLFNANEVRIVPLR